MAKFRGTNNYIGAWHYVLLDIVYSIPVIGWIVLLIHALDKNNEIRMHYARSRFVHALIWFVILVIVFVVLYFTIGQKYFNHQKEIDDVFAQYQPKIEKIVDQMNEELSNIPTN